MADWTNIPDTTFEPGAPAKGRDMRYLRDNPIAIAEGAPGAPRISGQQGPVVQNGGVFNGTLGAEKFQTGTTERDWVLARCAAASVGAVGTYAFLAATDALRAPGDTLGGSSLRYASVSGTSTGINPSGTWRLMGRTLGSSSAYSEANTTLWLRIS